MNFNVGNNIKTLIVFKNTLPLHVYVICMMDANLLRWICLPKSIMDCLKCWNLMIIYVDTRVFLHSVFIPINLSRNEWKKIKQKSGRNAGRYNDWFVCNLRIFSYKWLQVFIPKYLKIILYVKTNNFLKINRFLQYFKLRHYNCYATNFLFLCYYLGNFCYVNWLCNILWNCVTI